MRAEQTSGKEHYLLNAIKRALGAEALEYTVVLFIHKHQNENPGDALKNCCVKMCHTKHFFLEDNEKNVEELFGRIEAMSRRKKKVGFFVQANFENVMKTQFEPWEKAQVKRRLKEVEEERRRREGEFQALRRNEAESRKELEECRQGYNAWMKDLETVRCSERQLRKQLEELRDLQPGHLKSIQFHSKEVPPCLAKSKPEPLDGL